LVVRCSPRLTRLQPVGEDVALVLETPSGTVHIDGETILAGVRYRWDGEETYGMLERSNPLDKFIGRGDG
jgi:hypothetical protein